MSVSILLMPFVIISVVSARFGLQLRHQLGLLLKCRLDSMGAGHRGDAFNARLVLFVPFSACYSIGYAQMAQIIMF